MRICNPPPETYNFEEKTIFKQVSGLNERCIICNKKILHYYNSEHDIMLDICSNPKCMDYEAFDFHDHVPVLLNLNQLELEYYFD